MKFFYTTFLIVLFIITGVLNLSAVAPIAMNDSVQTDEDVSIAIPVVDRNDVDADNDITSIDTLGLIGALHGRVVIDNDSLIYTPDLNYNGRDSFQYTVRDAAANTDTAWVFITIVDVNDAPRAENWAITIDEDMPFVKLTADLSKYDIDGVLTDINVLTDYGLLQGSVRINSDSIIYTPNLNYFGGDIMQYSVTDDDGASDTAWVMIVINGVNDLPVALNDTVRTDEGSPIVIPVLDNDHDVDGSIVLMDTVGLPRALHGSILFDDFDLVYTPHSTFTGKDSLQYFIVDDFGAMDTAWVFVTINSEPLAVNDAVMTDEDNVLTISGLDNNDSDLDGHLVSVEIAGLTPPSDGFLVTTDSLRYIPNRDFSGVDSFQYAVVDNDGGRDTAWVIITVNEINDRPVATDDYVFVDEDNTAMFAVVERNDADVDGNIVLLDLTGLIGSKHGLALVVGDSLQYTPDQNFYGQDSLQYLITDNDGAKDTAWVFITINDINDAPTAVNDSVVTGESESVLVPVVALNDYDVDGRIMSLQISGLAPPRHGSVLVVGQDLQYTPQEFFWGEDSLQYEITDDDGAKDTAWLKVSVISADEDPSAIEDSVMTDFIHGQEVIVPNIVGNDRDPDGDIDSSSVLFLDPETGLHVGELSIAGEGTWSYDKLFFDVIFTPDSVSYKEPSTVQYVIYDKRGHESLPAIIRIEYMKYSVVYDGNGADSHVPTYVWDPVEGYKISIDEMIPRLEGYMFRGWEVVTTGLTDTLQANDIFVLPPSDVTFLAIWEEIFVEEAFVPNVFTPNGDGIHDTYVIPWSEEIGEPIHLTVFNQWGDLVYEHDSYDNSWDGEPNRGVVVGTELPVGTYYYRIEVKGTGVKTRQGYIYLKR